MKNFIPSREEILERMCKEYVDRFINFSNKFLDNYHCEFNADKCPVFQDCIENIKVHSKKCKDKRMEWILK